ncbi:hypothetical protein HK102_006610, partial [Quaeritorhiza haematococci]
MALRYHPDKTGADPAAAEIFQRVARAYEVLSDEKKRKIYDLYGEPGIRMMESMGEVAPFIDPDLVLAMNWFFFAGSLFAALLILFPAFVSVRADGKVEWPWLTVFIPAFIVDFFVLLGSLMPSAVEDDDEDDENGGAGGGARPTFEDEEERRRRKKRKAEEKGKRKWGMGRPGSSSSAAAGTSAEGADGADGAADDHAGPSSLGGPRRDTGTDNKDDLSKKVRGWALYFARVTYFVSLILLQIFIACRLDDRISWTWAGVFVPWYIMEGYHFAITTLSLLRSIAQGKPVNPSASSHRPPHSPTDTEANRSTTETRPMTHKEIAWEILDTYYHPILRIAQIVLLVLKLDDVTPDMSWAVVFIPAYLVAFLPLLDWVLTVVEYKRYGVRGRRKPHPSGDEEDEDDDHSHDEQEQARARAEKTGSLALRAVGLAIFCALFYTFIGLLVKRLENNPVTSPTTAAILIPIFI